MSLFVALCCCVSAFAVPAWPGKYTYTQPDGTTIVLQKHGDEFFSWITNEAGEIVEKDEAGYYRPVPETRIQPRRSAGIRQRAEADESRRGPAFAPVQGVTERHFLVILVEFNDVRFAEGNNAQAFSNLLNQNGYNVNGATGSAQDYYYENSEGKFRPIFDVYGPVTLEKNRVEYGEHVSEDNDKDAAQAIVDGCIGLDDQIDFSQYDDNNDGEVDLVFMYYAGKGEADSNEDDSIWPHQWWLESAKKDLVLDGKKINGYACSNEIIGSGSMAGKLCGIGTACHEFGHAIGLPDLYDTDYDTNGKAGGLYTFSLMASGAYNNVGRTPPYFNIEERIILGWLEPSAIQEISISGNYTLGSVHNNVAYKTPTDMNGEYFLYECRNNSGWDQYIPEHGLIVYHVDKSSRQIPIQKKSQNPPTAEFLWTNWLKYNSINENGSHPCFYVVPAGAESNLNYGGSKFAFPGKAGRHNFTGKSWNGVSSSVKLSNITYDGTTAKFYAEVPSLNLDYNVIYNPKNGSYAVGDVFEFTLNPSMAQPYTSVSWFFDDEPVTASSVTLSAGTHVVEAHMTMVSGGTKIVELTLEAQ